MCLFPIILKTKQRVNCGRCYQCVSVRVSDWSIRLKHHYYNNPYAWFLTLTYNDEHIKFKSRAEGYLSTLCKRDLQLYFKRLRKRINRNSNKFQSLSYYAIGEYGDRTYRPHYHILLFSSNEISREDINSSWEDRTGAIGTVDIGEITPASVAYTVGYSFAKKSVPDKRRRLGTYYKIEQPFSLMSKRLGATQLELMKVGGIRDYLMSDFPNRLYYPVNGQKRHLPRYYFDQLFSTAEKLVFKQISTNFNAVQVLLHQRLDPTIKSHKYETNQAINKTKLDAKRKHRLHATGV